MGEESEYQTPLLELDSHSRIRDLSSVTIEEFLEHGPVAVRWWPRLVAWESRLLWILSGSSIIVSVSTFMLSFVTQMFSGHLGALELAGASIANVGIQGLAYGIMVRLYFFPSIAFFPCFSRRHSPRVTKCWSLIRFTGFQFETFK
jgi:MATE family multidrug resistance protein